MSTMNRWKITVIIKDDSVGERPLTWTSEFPSGYTRSEIAQSIVDEGIRLTLKKSRKVFNCNKDNILRITVKNDGVVFLGD